DDVSQRRQRRAGAVRAAVADPPQDLAVMPLEPSPELGNQPGLADACLAEDGHQLRAPLAGGLVEGGLEHSEIPRATDEMSRGRGRTASRKPDQAPAR